MSRDERVRRFGIECLGPDPAHDGIFFKAGTWRPGGEYIQKLIIRNVSTSVKKLKYKLPSTRYFSMSYPEPIILSPGIFKEVDVVFRPVEHDPYDDTIYIKMLDGIDGNGFHIPVRATIDQLSLRAPEGLDLGYCTTHQITSLTFHLVNTGEVDAPYEWDVPEPFSLVPSSGIVPVGTHHDITLSIRPIDASVFVAQAVCKVGQGVHAIIPNPLIVTKLSAIGKFAYINLSDHMLSFEEVVSGTKPEQKEIVLYNNSVVPAEFSLIRLDGDRDEVFDIEPKSGVIPPRSEIPVYINYRALAMGCYTLDRYAFRTPGNCNTILTLKGTSMPPKVSIFKDTPPAPPGSTNALALTSQTSVGTLMGEEGAPLFSLNFRDIEIGRVETRLLYIRNDSHREVPFCIIADPNGIFKFSPRQGIIPPLMKNFPVKVVFVPPKPINYYRRFFVLVGDSMPLFYDCMGTGFIRAKGEIKEQRPAPIRHAHIQAYRNRCVQGLGGLSPDELDRLHEDPNFPSHYFAQIGRTGTRAMSVTSLQRPVTRTGESVRNLVAPAHEFFIENTDSTAREVIVNRVQLDFGYTASRGKSTPQSVVIHNNTKAKVVVQWNVPIVQGMELVVAQQPKRAKEKEIITVDRAEKEMESVQAFSVSPALAEINPGQSQSFDVIFVPKMASRNFLSELEAYVFFKNQRTFRLVNDHSLTPPWCVTVSAIGHTFASGQLLAKAQFLGGGISHGKLVFLCCCQGESTYQTFMIRNTSNLPSTFHVEMGWRADASSGATSRDGVFSVKPSMGEIDAESFVMVCVRFAPALNKKYTELMRLIINGDEGGKLLLEGQGSQPYVIIPDLSEDKALVPEQIWGIPLQPPKFIPKGMLGDLYMKPTCVGLTNTRKLTLKNASRLPLKYRVMLPPNADNILAITPLNGILRGNDDIKLTVTFAPKETMMYDFKITVQVYPIGGKPKRILDANQPGVVDPPELLQQCSLMIHAQGEIGAITFDPAHTDADVRLVHTQEEKSIWLENISDSDLQYKLHYREEFEADVVDRPITRASSEIMPLQTLAGFQASGKLHKGHDFDHSLLCAAPEGVIAARSRLRVVFTYRPVKSGLFFFSIFAQIHALDPTTKDPIALSNDEAALLRLAGPDASMDVLGNFANDLSSLPLTATFSARAAFPKMLFEDIRTDFDIQISDVDYLWKRFSFPQLNYDLSVPMTREEIAINNSSSPDLTKLKVYPFEFAPAVVNSPIQSVTILLKNHGYLETKFHIHLPNAKQLELENWCDEDDPSEELNRLICIIEELKLFSIEPSHGHLMPGESCVLKVSYKHSSLKYNGYHNLPVLVKLSQGKQFYLDIRGKTLASSVVATRRSNTKVGFEATTSIAGSPSMAGESRVTSAPTVSGSGIPDILLVLGAHRHDGTLHLAPVPIGLSSLAVTGYAVNRGTYTDSAPLQKTELINVSAFPVNYEVFIARSTDDDDLAIDEIVKKENFHMEVMKCANNQGLILGGNSIHLEWYFYPMEEKEYEFPVVIRYYTNPSFIAPVITESSVSLTKSPSRKTSQQSRKGLVSRSQSNPIVAENTLINSSAAAAPQIVYRYLLTTIKVKGYDPRKPKPVSFESNYIGGEPSIRPVLKVPEKPVYLFEDYVHFNLIPQRSRVKRILTLINDSATQSFDFAVDEPSCLLSIDGLLAVNPVFGKVEPKSRALIELTFQGFAQSMVFEDHIKIMIREIIKASNKSRGGTRQQIIDRLKARKVQEVEHESVVGRATFARSMQILLSDHGELARPPTDHDPTGDNALEERKRKSSKYPTTITLHGKVLQPDLTKTINTLMRPQEDWEQDLQQVTRSEMGGGETFVLPQEKSSMFNANSTSAAMLPVAPEPSRLKAPSVGFADQPPATGASRLKTASFAPGTASAEGSVVSGTSRGKMMSSHSRAQTEGSRGALSTGTGRETTGTGTSRKGTGEGGYTLFGTTYILIARLKGEVYSEQTITLIHERNKYRSVERKDNEGVEVNEEEVKLKKNPLFEYVIPKTLDFIPPIGKKFFDSEFIAEQERIKNKSKVNIKFVHGRDEELRTVTQSIFDSLIKNTLNLPMMSESLLATLIADNPAEVTLNEKDGLNPFKDPYAEVNGKYGIYYREVENELPLHQRMIIELKYMEYMTANPAFDVNKKLNIDSTWQKKGEDNLLILDDKTFALFPGDLKTVLEQWRMFEAPIFRDIIADLDVM